MKTIVLSLVFMFTLSLAYSQDESPKPEKWKDVTWHEVVMVKYQAGTFKRVNEILDMYKKAGKNAMVEGPKIYWLVSGEYDAMFIWHLEKGPADLEWRRTEDGIKWWNAFIEVVGSKEKADELSKEYSSYIINSTSYVSMKEMNKM
ncbi:hypothetical protein [Saccharicrinis sp. FJH54]|uniref:hypothetical protein n=1 Tax=Saccharicrinis sp. FJH54 TaxID=3344665 RepID=UPI0035D4A325